MKIGKAIIVYAFSVILGQTIVDVAHATVIERTVDVDLKSLALPSSEITTTFSIDSATMDVGDTFVFHFSFQGDRLQIVDTRRDSEEYLGWQFVSTIPGGTGFLFNTHFHFEGVKGNLLTNDFVIRYGGPIGAFLPNWNLTDNVFSFTELTLTFDIFFKEPGRPAFTTEAVDFYAYFNPPSGLFLRVPEPTTFALMGLGLAGIGYRRHRSKIAA